MPLWAGGSTFLGYRLLALRDSRFRFRCAPARKGSLGTFLCSIFLTLKPLRSERKGMRTQAHWRTFAKILCCTCTLAGAQSQNLQVRSKCSCSWSFHVGGRIEAFLACSSTECLNLSRLSQVVSTDRAKTPKNTSELRQGHQSSFSTHGNLLGKAWKSSCRMKSSFWSRFFCRKSQNLASWHSLLWLF